MDKEITGRLPDGRSVRIIVSSDGFIAGIEEVQQACETNDWLALGLVDLQVNGYLGDDFNGNLDVSAVARIVRNLLRAGTTTFLPTLITASQDVLLRNLSVIAAARATDPAIAAAIPGVHMKGPWISPQDGFRGAHPLEHVRAPSLAEFDEWQRASENLVRLVTLSPHWKTSCDAIKALIDRGVAVSLGHTHANPEEIHAAAAAGATLSTHLGNGLPQLLPRHPNPIWAQLAEDRLVAMLIADGHHLSADTLKAMICAKGAHRCVLTSDLVALAGMPSGRYETPVGGTVELDESGRLHVQGTQMLAGATATLADNVALLVSLTGNTLETALSMATENPSRLLGLTRRLVPGAPADFMRFQWMPGDRMLKVSNVWLHGQRIV